MLRAFRSKCRLRATFRILLIASAGLTGTIVLQAIASPALNVHASSRFASNPSAQQSSEQRLPTQTPAKKAALQGLVRDAGGKPIIAARVILTSTSSRQDIERNTDAQGVFRFIDLPPGAYQLHIRAPGYQDLPALETQLKAGDTLVRELSLVASPSNVQSSAQIPELPPGSSTGASNVAPSGQPVVAPVLNQGAVPTQAAQPSAENLPSPDQVFRTEPDRWLITMPHWDRYGIGGEYPYVKGSRWDPFNRNKWKGDVPIFGKQTFLNITGISDTFVDGRRLPVPSNISSAQPGSSGFFGKGEQLFLD
jgi:Carboxypeptidase regulatory-like domain